MDIVLRSQKGPNDLLLMTTTYSIPFGVNKPFGPTIAPPITPVDATKLGLAAAMFVGVLVATLTPVLVINRLAGRLGERNAFTQSLHPRQQVPRWRHLFVLWVGRLSCFAGGVFLSTGFMDLFPDVEEALERAQKALNITAKFPLAPCLTLLGFFTILTVEQVILVCKETDPRPSHPSPTHHQGNRSHRNPILSDQRHPTTSDTEDDVAPLLDNQDSSHPHHHSTAAGHASIQSLEGISDHPIYNRSNSQEDCPHETDTDHLLASNNEHGDHYDDLTMHSSLRVVLLLCAMSIHAVFEGMAVGLQTTSKGVMELFVALCLHKLVIAAGVGLSLATSGLRRSIAILACFIFAVASPLGVVGGFGVRWAEDRWGGGFVLANGILQGLACGTFFYVVFFEILPHEFNTGQDRMGKVFCLLMGFGLVCLFIGFFPD